MKGKTQLEPVAGAVLNLADFFDPADGSLRALGELSREQQACVLAFEVRRITIRSTAETIVTEELIRVRLRSGRTAAISKRGGGSLTARRMAQKPVRPRLAVKRERSAGSGQTEKARQARD